MWTKSQMFEIQKKKKKEKLKFIFTSSFFDSHDNCIQVGANKSSIGSIVLEITSLILRT